MNSKVSIIIPLYNREQLILDTLKSLYSQTYKNWEAIIVDDHSTDNSFEVVDKAAEQDERIKVFKRVLLPKGAPTCRNIGVSLAEGDFVVFLDSDDLLAPYCLEERLKQFEIDKNLDFLVFNGAFFEMEMGDTNMIWNIFLNENDLERFLKGDIVWQTSGPIWKTEALKFHNHTFCELAKSSQDWEFHVNALLKQMSYKKVEGLPDYFVRRSPSQSTNSISSSHRDLDKFINRIQVYKLLFKDNKLTPSHNELLFSNLNNDIFNVYRNLSFKDLGLLKNEIQNTHLFHSNTVAKHILFYKFLKRFNRLTGNKSHQVYYYYKKRRSGKAVTKRYKSTMPEKMYEDLKKKLKD